MTQRRRQGNGGGVMKYVPWIVIGLIVVAIWDTSYRLDARNLQNVITNGSWLIALVAVLVLVPFGVTLALLSFRAVTRQGQGQVDYQQPRRQSRPRQQQQQYALPMMPTMPVQGYGQSQQYPQPQVPQRAPTRFSVSAEGEDWT